MNQWKTIEKIIRDENEKCIHFSFLFIKGETMKNWYLIYKKENFRKIKNCESLTPIQKIILANRNITKQSEIDMIAEHNIKKMYSPFLLKDMDKAVDIVFDSMMNGERIRIVGDYDQDGIAATTILHKGLSNFYEDVSYAIPNRVEEGYGLNNSIVQKCLDENISLIITCDNGIAAFDAIDFAINNGIKVIITDHHEVIKENGKDILPKANAILNPWRSDDNSTFKKICGALVAYKLVEAMHDKYGADLGIDKKKVYSLLQYAALGTVVDMMELVDENRLVVVEGLKYLNKTNNPGLKALLYELNWNKEIDVYTIGFIIGPIINASGRIYTAKLGVELFLEEDEEIVIEYARELISINQKRKEMTLDSVEFAIQKILDEKLFLNDIIILYNEDIHESICGLVAGRIKDRFNKPTIVFTDASNGTDGLVKGSGRSIDAYDMHKKLSEFSHLYTAFGGHKKACGLSMEKKKLNELIIGLNSNSGLKEDDFVKSIEFDYALNFKYINLKIIDEISKLEPFGYGFKKPMFATKSVLIKNISLIGKNKNVMRYVFQEGEHVLQGISFNIEEEMETYKAKFNIEDVEEIEKLIGQKIDIVYKLSVNNYNDLKNIQLEIEAVR